MNEQIIIRTDGNYGELNTYLENKGIKRIFLVCDSSIGFLKINSFFEGLENISVTRFSDFEPNPLYESVVKGVDVFNNGKCDCIIAVGGGSAIDVAKCIKLYSAMDKSKNYLEQEIVPNDIPFIAVPTTAGTGSEATRFAVIYYKGEKQSVTDISCIPDAAILDSSVLDTLPLYQRKATMLDALCHSVESFWSVNSNDESKKCSKRALEMIIVDMDSYLMNDKNGNTAMMEAAHIAGKAINITQTTAAHAMCYKLTSLYKIAHGHAAALCLPVLWEYMLSNMDKCIDGRGKEYLKTVFDDIAKVLGCDIPIKAVEKLKAIIKSLELPIPTADENDFEILNTSVNPVRLKNNPVALDIDAIDEIYHRILNTK